MRSATLFAALVLSFSVLSLSTPANASPAQRLWTFDLFAPSAPAKKSVVTKRASVKQAAQKRTVEYYPVETSRADYAIETQQKRIAKHSRKVVDATRSTQNNFFTMWQAWTAPVAYPQPRTRKTQQSPSD